MKNISYREFLQTVKVADGPFSYLFNGYRGLCDPKVYLALHWPDGLPKSLE